MMQLFRTVCLYFSLFTYNEGYLLFLWKNRILQAISKLGSSGVGCGEPKTGTRVKENPLEIDYMGELPVQ